MTWVERRQSCRLVELLGADHRRLRWRRAIGAGEPLPGKDDPSSADREGVARLRRQVRWL